MNPISLNIVLIYLIIILTIFIKAIVCILVPNSSSTNTVPIFIILKKEVSLPAQYIFYMYKSESPFIHFPILLEW